MVTDDDNPGDFEARDTDYGRRGPEEYDEGAFRLAYVFLGPARYVSSSLFTAMFLFFVFFALTAVAQVGGLVLWLGLPVLDLVYRKVAATLSRAFGLALVVLLFWFMMALFSYLIVPAVAPSLAGRVPLPCSRAEDATLRPVSKWACFLNRNYVVPELRARALEYSKMMAKRPGTEGVYYLDAGFPFFDWFPIFPHPDHMDGRALDLAFAYEGAVPPPSPFGYWVYSGPAKGEVQPCRGLKGTLRWDAPWLQKKYGGVKMDPEGTFAMLAWWLDAGKASRILIEPHLQVRFGLADERVRFAGCAGTRHDDHFQVEIP